jgi:hypothetical protein
MDSGDGSATAGIGLGPVLRGGLVDRRFFDGVLGVLPVELELGCADLM